MCKGATREEAGPKEEQEFLGEVRLVWSFCPVLVLALAAPCVNQGRSTRPAVGPVSFPAADFTLAHLPGWCSDASCRTEAEEVNKAGFYHQPERGLERVGAKDSQELGT